MVNIPLPSKKLISKKLIAPFVVLLISLVVGISIGYAFKMKRDYQKLKTDFQKLKTAPQENELEKLTKEIGKLMLLPKNETPTLATVTDVANIKQNQPFFSNAENGDKVLVYSQAKKAILYRPSINKIVEVAPINVIPSPGASLTPAASATPTVTSLVKIALYNGTKIVGLAKKVEQYLRGKIVDFKVVARGNTKNDYVKNIVIDLSGNQKELTEQIAGVLKGEVGSLPEGELKPEADILLILGTDIEE